MEFRARAAREQFEKRRKKKQEAGPSYRLARDADEFGMTAWGEGGKRRRKAKAADREACLRQAGVPLRSKRADKAGEVPRLRSE